MTDRWHRVQGDANDTLVAQIDGVADLTGVTAIEAHVWSNTSGALPAGTTTLVATVLDAEDRTVTVNLSTGSWLNTATGGTWNLEIQVTWGTQVRTFPAARPASIVVRVQGA